MKLLKKLYSIHSKSGKEWKMIKFLLWWIRKNIPEARVELDPEAGNIYVTKGVSDTYPCIVAHTDQVQDIHSKDFQAIETNNIIFGWSARNKRFEGLGADDKNGIWVALKCLTRFDNIKIAFFAGEEVGCIGSRKANMDFFVDCRFVIQCDRRGSSDMITSISCTELCGKEFVAATNHELYGYQESNGAMTDVLALKESGLQVSCINLSCGYYDPHSDNEFTIKHDLLKCLHFVEHIIEHCTGVYPHQYEYGWGTGNFYDDLYDYYYDDVYTILSNHPELSVEEIWAAFKDYYPQVNRQELEMAYEMVKQDLEFWNTKDEDDGTTRDSEQP